MFGVLTVGSDAADNISSRVVELTFTFAILSVIRYPFVLLCALFESALKAVSPICLDLLNRLAFHRRSLALDTNLVVIFGVMLKS